MKLATLKAAGKRDGELVIVSRDLTRYKHVPQISENLQSALDRWSDLSPALVKVYDELNKSNEGENFTAALEQNKVAAPLPRAYEWIDASSYINHVILVRKARGAEPPDTLKTDPLIYQGGSGIFLGPRDPIPLADESWGCDFESEVAVVLDDTPQGVSADEAAKHIKLFMAVNDVSLRNLIPAELLKGFGFFCSKPASAFAPVAVTADELKFENGRVQGPLVTHYNGTLFGDPDAGPEMFFSFPQLIAHICKTRAFTAGTILGSGTVSNEDRKRGSSCLAEKRMIETIDSGKAVTPFMKVGDTIEIEMKNESGQSIFGKISQKVTKL